jgi:hypothetical protein
MPVVSVGPTAGILRSVAPAMISSDEATPRSNE